MCEKQPTSYTVAAIVNEDEASALSNTITFIP